MAEPAAARVDLIRVLDLRAPQALSHALADAVADREPLFPRVTASPEAFFQRCRDLRPAFIAAVFRYPCRMSSWLIPLRLALLWALAVLSANVEDRVVIGLAVALTAAVGYWEWREHSRALSQATRAKRLSGFVDERVTALRHVPARLIAEADTMLREILDDGANQMAKRRRYEERIEDWRTRVGRFLTEELRNPGLVSKCLPKMGAVTGNPIAFLHSRLERCRTNLAEVQAELADLVAESVQAGPRAS